MLPTPTCYTLVAGAAEANKELTAFDKALLEAGVGNVNLLRVSSILPPCASYQNTFQAPLGSLIPIAYGSITSKEPGALIAASVGVGIDQRGFGVIMEFSGYCSKSEAEKQAKEMVEEAFHYRGIELIDVKTAAVEHKVISCGCVFAAVPLWYEKIKI